MKMYHVQNRINSSELIHYITSVYIDIHIQERKTANKLVICISIIKLANNSNVSKLIICEEKYSFTPDDFKAYTREQRKTKSDKM